MTWRRRRGAAEEADPAPAEGTTAQDGATTGDDGADEPGAPGAPVAPVEPAGPRVAEGTDPQALEEHRRAVGPFDASEVEPDRGRIDLGALRLTAPAGMELRLEVEEASKRVVAATLGLGGSTVQLHVFAAPRTDGVWDDVRSEIAESVTKQGGTAEVVDVLDGFGRELLVRLPARTADGRTGHVASRFTGVDGPRWFLRAVFSGAAALDRAAAAPLERVVRAAVVVRGADAMAPRDLIALQLPAGAPARVAGPPAAPAPAPPAGAPAQPSQAQATAAQATPAQATPATPATPPQPTPAAVTPSEETP